MNSINQSAVNLLEQIKKVVSHLTDAQYAQPLQVLSDASVGQHVRHALEFFQCLAGAKRDREINYDSRNHNTDLQEQTLLAINLINVLQEDMLSIQDDFELKLFASYELTDNIQLTMNTTYQRELAYNIEHAIHHMALLKIGIRDSFGTIVLPEHFGVASSTVRFYQPTSQS